MPEQNAQPVISAKAMTALGALVRQLEALIGVPLARALGAPVAPPADAALSVLRLVLVRQAEAAGLIGPTLTMAALEHPAPLHRLEESVSRLGADLPGLLGHADGAAVASEPALRAVIAAMAHPDLDPLWDDATTLGWVYQLQNDPRREEIDRRVGPRGKVPAHEVASKTQLFTDHYMVEWLLVNSLGRVARAMRQGRGGGGAGPRAEPMYVDAAAIPRAADLPARLKDLRLLDPACGAGHFLSDAFDRLVDLYREEGADLDEPLTSAQIADRILRDNLYGVDLDPRAVQIAAAMLYLKARRLVGDTEAEYVLPPLNLVAASFVDDASAPPPDDGERASIVREVLARASFAGSLLRLRGEGDAAILRQYTGADDLGLRTSEPMTMAGARLCAIVSQRYDVIVINPPYLATSKIDAPAQLAREVLGDAPDLFAAFVERALQLCKPRGYLAFVALSNWMSLRTFQSTRELLLRGHLVLLADLGKGAFRRASRLIQTAMVVATPQPTPDAPSLVAQVGSRESGAADQPERIAADLADPRSYRPLDARLFAAIDGAPWLYTITPDILRRYIEGPKIGDVAEGMGGIATTDNERFLRATWEVSPEQARAALRADNDADYVPYLKGADGREWIAPHRWLLRVPRRALELRLCAPSIKIERSVELGVAYTTIGHRFAARLHTALSVRDVSGASLYAREGASVEQIVCAMNRTEARELASALNPTVNYQLGDVRRLPFLPHPQADLIIARLRAEFATAERGDELSLSYQGPSPSAWTSAQAWAQRAVDNPADDLQLPTELRADPPQPARLISHAVGLALGRFAGPSAPLPGGILWLGQARSSIEAEACAPLRRAWLDHGASLGGGSLIEHLRERFFGEHKRQYEALPIYWPISSARRSFVAFVHYHQLSAATLTTLLGDYLLPERLKIEARLTTAKPTERALAKKLLAELDELIGRVRELDERGPRSPDAGCPLREADARFDPDPSDGIAINSAVMWKLLFPLWKEPRQWYGDLARASGKRRCDWPQAAARYFPRRVADACVTDASLAAAHGCLWAHHAALAYSWEMTLSSEAGQVVTIDEEGAEAARARFLREEPAVAAKLRARAQRRREAARAPAGSPIS